MPDLGLDGWELGQEFKVIQGTITHTGPFHQQVFGLELQVLANGIRTVAAFEDFLEIAHQMAPTQLDVVGEPQLGHQSCKMRLRRG